MVSSFFSASAFTDLCAVVNWSHSVDHSLFVKLYLVRLTYNVIRERGTVLVAFTTLRCTAFGVFLNPYLTLFLFVQQVRNDVPTVAPAIGFSTELYRSTYNMWTTC